MILTSGKESCRTLPPEPISRASGWRHSKPSKEKTVTSKSIFFSDLIMLVNGHGCPGCQKRKGTILFPYMRKQFVYPHIQGYTNGIKSVSSILKICKILLITAVLPQNWLDPTNVPLFSYTAKLLLYPHTREYQWYNLGAPRPGYRFYTILSMGLKILIITFKLNFLT